jgi:hypothetical protein
LYPCLAFLLPLPSPPRSYCLCAGGLQAAFHGCEERATFTCAAVCAKLPKPTAAPPASAGNAWGRLAKRAQTPAARQAAARIAVAQMKRRAAAKVAAAYAKREHAAKVALADKLLGHTPKTAAEAEANIKALMKVCVCVWSHGR